MKACWLLAGLGLLLSASASWADPEIVIAIRYLQAEGVSHAHLYLYREDGKLLRQLTKDNSGQERDPIFAPDGRTIVFTREVGAQEQIWSVEPLGKNLRRLPAAPEWYGKARTSPYFTNFGPPEGEEELPEGVFKKYRSPDGAVELELREKPEDDHEGVDEPGHGKSYVLRDLQTKEETEFGRMPGFYGAWDALRRSDNFDSRFLLEGPLRLAFFSLHLDSTEGSTTFALHLAERRLVRLGASWATPIPLPGEAAFLALNYERYVPIPGSQKTANCLYVERWNAKLEKIRYAKAGSAAIAYGFSMYRPGKKPAVIVMRKAAD